MAERGQGISMNAAIKNWVQGVIEREWDRVMDARVLEIGSYNVNGSVREQFGEAETYVGVDIRPGPGVDHVIERYESLGPFDVVICCEVLEHEPEPAALMDQIEGALKEGGMFIITTRGIGYGLHDAPEDYWRFTQYGLEHLISAAGLTALEVVDDKEAMGVYAYGVK